MPFLIVIAVVAIIYSASYLPAIAATVLAGTLALGPFWFWALLVVSTVVLIALVEYEQGTWATVTLLIVMGLLQFKGDIKVFNFIGEHPMRSCLYLLAYFAAGAIWSIIKWWFYVRKTREGYDEKKKEFLEQNGVSVMNDSLKNKWKSTCAYQSYGIPDSLQHKAKIVTWMTYWPWSLVWTMINDPIRRAFDDIYRLLRSQYQKIADKAYGDIKDDFEKK
jgi:hypothetical protein